jgi:hypothetical protein
MRTTGTLTLAVASGLLAAACSEGPSDVTSDTLTRTETVSLAAQLGLESLAFAQEHGSPQGAEARVRGAAPGETVTVSYDIARPCVLGGWVDSRGTVYVITDTEPDRATVDIVATDVHRACVFLADGRRIAVTGDPDVTSQVHVATLEGELVDVLSVSVLGAVLWESEDGREGRCEIDVRVEVDPAAHTQTTRGRFCRYEFDVTVTAG